MARLLLWFRGRLIDLADERFNPRGFLFEAGDEIVRAVFEKHDEAEGKENE
jgi:hypothetical protein